MLNNNGTKLARALSDAELAAEVKRRRQLKAPTKKSLKETLHSKLYPKLRAYTKTKTRKETNEEKERFKARRKEARKVRALRWRMRGLDCQNGMVKLDTKVLYANVTSLDLSQDALFDCPVKVLRHNVRLELFTELWNIETEIKMTLAGKQRKDMLEHMELVLGATNTPWHRYGGNKGVSLAMSVQPGSKFSGKNTGVSGTIQKAKWAKQHPDVAKRAQQTVQAILDAAFGSDRWYRRALAYCKRLNEQAGNEERTIWGTVFSGLWFTLVTKECSIHKDHNVCGPSFLLSTYEPQGCNGCLTVKTDKARHPENIIMRPGTILGGSWAQCEHCNSNVSQDVASNRTSWVIYLDKRVFGANYIYRA